MVGFEDFSKKEKVSVVLKRRKENPHNFTALKKTIKLALCPQRD